jgi:hypothetical protein
MSGPLHGYRSNYDAVMERSETLRRENKALRAELARLRTVLEPQDPSPGRIPRPVLYVLGALVVLIGLALLSRGPSRPPPTRGTAAPGSML